MIDLGKEGFTILAARKFAITSFIHTSLNHRMVTKSPNHMCEVSWEIVLARPSNWFCVADSSSSNVERYKRWPPGVPCHRIETRESGRSRICPRDKECRCTLRATPARGHADRKSHRDCALPSPHPSPDETCGKCGRCAPRSRRGIFRRRTRTDTWGWVAFRQSELLQFAELLALQLGAVRHSLPARWHSRVSE